MKQKKKLGQILLEAGVISQHQLRDALEDQKRYSGKLGTILLERRFITEKDFFSALTRQLGIPAVDFTRSTIPEAVIKTVPLELAEKHTVFPVAAKHTAQGKVIVLAMADPTNVEIQDEVRFTTGCRVEPAIALENTIRYAIREYYYQQDGKGSYRMDPDLTVDSASNDSRVNLSNSRLVEPEEPRFMAGAAEPELIPEDMNSPETAAAGFSEESRPQLSRELKALLKLLAKKGLITPKEYFDIFKDTK